MAAHSLLKLYKKKCLEINEHTEILEEMFSFCATGLKWIISLYENLQRSLKFYVIVDIYVAVPATT